MRDFQTKTNLGGGADSITTTKYGAGEFNALATENENAVTRAGLPLAPSDGTGEVSTQIAQSLFIHGVKSTGFQAGGAVNAITLTPISGSSGVFIPDSYDNLDGARLIFTPTGANTGAVTASIGQTSGTQLGTKAVLDEAGSALTGGEIGTSKIEVTYDASADGGSGGFLLAPWVSASVSSVSGFDTGDILPTFKQTAKTGFLIINGDTVGSAGSAATQNSAANQALFEFLWDNSIDADMPVSTGRGANAAADWAANKTITMVDARGRSGIGYGSGGGLSETWTMGETGGEEDHVQTTAEMASHTHTISYSNDGNGSDIRSYDSSAQTQDGTNPTNSTGSSTAFNVIHPVFGMNWQVKI